MKLRKVRLTKKNGIILAVVITILSVALGFLIWRVNQEETTAPTESEASQSCNWGSECTNKCYWPETTYCNSQKKCECLHYQQQTVNPCYAPQPGCEPSCKNGDKYAEVRCICPSCSNPYYVRISCPYCGDGNLDSGEECDPSGSACTKNGKSGTCTDSCTCKINPYCGDGNLDSGEECEPSTSSVCTKDGKTGTCSDSCTCEINPFCGDGKLDPGEECENYTDGGLTGAPCSWNECNHTTCRCLPGDLVLTKTVVETCVDENSANPKAELLYTITLSNNGQGPARPDKIEDVLDLKVTNGGIVPIVLSSTGLSNPEGIYSNGKIVWDFNDSMVGDIGMLPGTTFETKYKITVSKENFGRYSNTATLINMDGTTLQANASIEADCVIMTPPQTGLFDTTSGKMVVGILLILFGGIVYNIPSAMFIYDKKEQKFIYRKKFENSISSK